MNTLEQIDVKKFINQEDFLKLFTSQLDLKEDEISKILNVYYPMYTTFTSTGVSFDEAWLAIKNVFISQETQIGERLKK